MKTVKTTKIEKKYKDKKTGEWKSLTIDYAKIPDRLKKFWEDNPRGKIKTTPNILDDGRIMFEAYILRDKSDESSREATGHTIGSTVGEKDFEKLETLAVGRALALLGYAGSGEIASSEEMEEFEKYQKERSQARVKEATDKLKKAKNLDDLKKIWAELDAESKTTLSTLKDEIKAKYENPKISD